MTTITETYLDDEAYEALIDGLLNSPCACDPRSRVMELLGEIANVWPASVLADSLSERAIENYDGCSI